MARRNLKETLFYISITLLAFIFWQTAISKFLDFQGFLHAMKIQPFPNRYAIYVAWAIPFVELGITLSFFFDRTRLLGLYTALMLMATFTIYAAMVLLHIFPFVPCSCGGFVSFLKWGPHFILNLILSVISLWSIKAYKEIRAKKMLNTTLTTYA